MADYIPEDNLVVILKNLPVKSLLRFRCVSKLWKHVIDSPWFVQEHLSVQNQNPRLLILKEKDPNPLVVDPHTLCTLPLGFSLRSYFLCGAQHGIVCLYDIHNEKDLLLWNPAIRKFSVLPIPDIFDCKFSRLTQEGCVGFWIDPSNQEFKFIALKLRRRWGWDTTDGVVYSSIRQDWRVIPCEEEGKWKPLHECPMVGRAGYWGMRHLRPTTELVGRVGNWGNGRRHLGRAFMIASVAYWQGSYYWSENDAIPDEVVLSFDFVQEKFEFIEVPFQWIANSILLQLQGTLSLLYYPYIDGTAASRRFDIYSRQGDSWVHMFGFDLRVPVRVVYWALGETEDCFRVLAETEHGDVHHNYFTFLTDTPCVAPDFVESLLLLPTSVDLTPSIYSQHQCLQFVHTRPDLLNSLVSLCGEKPVSGVSFQECQYFNKWFA